MDQYLAWFLLAAPLAASIAILVHLHRKPNMAVFASVGSASICFLIALGISLGSVPSPAPWNWISFPAYGSSFPGFTIDIGMILDPLAKGMLLVVTGVGLLVHIFSIGYMSHDPGRARFFGGLSIFMFSMTGIVVATNLIMMFFFWEGVGLSSYLLIGFWFTRESAARAANKAFVCNRLADFGFMIGILTMWAMFGTVSVKSVDLANGAYQASHGGEVRSTLKAPATVPGTSADANGAPTEAMPAARALISPTPYLLTVMVICLFMGCVGQVGHVPAACLAARCDGGPDSRFCADPCRDDGGGGRLHAVPNLSAASAFPNGDDLDRLYRLLHRHLCRADRRAAKRHQAHPGLLDAFAAWLHGHGGRLRRPGRGDVPPDHPRLLQGAALPRRRRGHSRS